MQKDSPNPTLKGRLLNLESLARTMKETLSANQVQIKHIMAEIEEGTQSTILSDKISFIRSLLTEKLQQIDYKIKKHISQQKQKNNQLVELIGIVKNEKLRLQDHLSLLEERIGDIENKIGLAQRQF